jgi:hypothetical protein
MTIPEPSGTVTIPVIVVVGLIVVFALVRKLIALAIIGLLVAGVFVAYQAGALDHWVDKGKQVIQQEVSNK